MNARRLAAVLVPFLLALGSHTWLTTRVMEMRFALPPEYARAEALEVSPELLEITSGEFRGMMADYLVLDASYFLGGVYKTQPEDWETVALLFGQALRLDPYFFTPMYYTQGLLVWWDNVVEQAVDLLAAGHENRYWDWEPGFYAGFDYHEFLGRDDLAARYLKDAAERPHAPPIVGSLAARFSQNTGGTELAIVTLQVLLERTTDEAMAEELEKKLKAYQGLLILERALARFHERHAAWPDHLDGLVEDGLLAELPDNPINLEHFYYYDKESGEVAFDPFRD